MSRAGGVGAIIRALELSPHREGGYYRETFRHAGTAGVWQSAAPLGSWSLVGCTLAPAFDFAGFEMAPPGWQPSDDGA